MTGNGKGWNASEPLIFLALGGGVQSGTLAELVILGRLPRPRAVLFADTGAEHPATYRYIDDLETRLAGVGVPLYRVQQRRGLYEELLHEERVASPPFFVRDPRGRIGRLRRQCTEEYKIKPIEAFIRRWLLERGMAERTGNGIRVKPGVLVTLWLGISLDEWSRARTGLRPWLRFGYPLLDMRWTRDDCVRFLREQGLPIPPKSACFFCPYHRPDYWQRLAQQDPELWKKALELEKHLRRRDRAWLRRLRHHGPYLHPQARPLEEAVRDPTPRLMDEVSCDAGFCFL